MRSCDAETGSILPSRFPLTPFALILPLDFTVGYWKITGVPQPHLVVTCPTGVT
jgi:hypothetical protein